MIGDAHGYSNDRVGGIDIGKTSHWICAVDAEGRPLLSLKVANVEADLVAALAKVTDLAAEVVWALDIIGHRRR